MGFLETFWDIYRFLEAFNFREKAGRTCKKSFYSIFWDIPALARSQAKLKQGFFKVFYADFSEAVRVKFID